MSSRYSIFIQNIFNALERGAHRIKSGFRTGERQKKTEYPKINRQELSLAHKASPAKPEFHPVGELMRLADEMEDYKPSDEAKTYFKELITKIKDSLKAPATQFVLLGAMIGGHLGGLVEDGAFEQVINTDSFRSVPEDVKTELNEFINNSNEKIKTLITNGGSPLEISNEIINSLPERAKKYICENELILKGVVLGIIAAISYLENLPELGSQDEFAVGSFLGGFNLFRYEESPELIQMEADGSFETLKKKLGAFETALQFSNSNNIDFLSSKYRGEIESFFHHLDKVFQSSWEGSQKGQARTSLYLALRILKGHFRRWDNIFKDLSHPESFTRKSLIEKEHDFDVEKDAELFDRTFSQLIDLYPEYENSFQANLKAIGLNYKSYEKNLSRLSNLNELLYVLNEGIEAQHFGREDIRSVLNTLNNVLSQIAFSRDSSEQERLNSVFIALLVRCPKEYLQEMLESFDDPDFAVKIVRDHDHFEANDNLDLINESTNENFPQLLEYLRDPKNNPKPSTHTPPTTGAITYS